MTARRRAHRLRLHRPHRERGSISVFLAVLVPGLLLIIGLVVDGGAKVAATQRADAIAEEAARAGGQALDVDAALAGQLRVDPDAAVTAAQNYLNRNGVQGTVTIVDGGTLRVSTTLTQPTTFLGLIGISTLTVHGSGTSALVGDAGASGAGGGP